jgi:predicted transposase/invertase (TIGR01784 family)
MSVVKFESIEENILIIRGMQVILDSDVAELYGVETKRINEAVKNNQNRFPQGYLFELTNDELEDLRSKFTSAKFSKTRSLPKAFTEKGLYMLPEYYILKVNGFNDIAKDTLDEWMYFLKNSNIKSEFKAKGLKKASIELNVLKLSQEDREEYESYIEDRRVTESSVKTSWIEGKVEGKIEVAKRLILKGMCIEEAAEVAGVSVDVLKDE